MAGQCDPIDLLCKAGGWLGDAAGAVTGSAIDELAAGVLEATNHFLASVGTIWVNVGTPNLTSSGGGPSDAVAFIQTSLWYWTASLAVLSVLVGAGRLAWERRADGLRDLLRSVITLVVVSGAGLTTIALLVTASDEFSVWIIERSVAGTDFSTNLARLLGFTSRGSAPPTPTLGAVVLIVVGLVSIIVSFVQILLMVVRGGMLVILAGIFPTAAAFTNTEMGRSWFRKCVAWLIAFILYKPAAAIVYATAFRLVGSDNFKDDGSGLINVITGLTLMAIAVVALPALMRFVTPMVASVASGGGGGGAAGAMALAALPTGAQSLGRGAQSAAGSSTSMPGQHAKASQSDPSGSGSTGSTKPAKGSGGSAPGSPGGGGSAPSGGAAPTGAGASAAGTATAGAPAGGSGASSSTGAGAVAGGAAAAAGPIGVGVMAAQKVAQGAQAAAGAAAAAARESAGDEGGPSGSR